MTQSEAISVAKTIRPTELADDILARFLSEIEGRVEIDYEVEERTDRPLAEGMTLSIRGYGKFTIRSLSDKTRKGRLRLLAHRHV